jgi:hypothetical protein
MAGAAVSVLLVIWLVIAFACASIARSKGLSAGGYFFLGLFLGVIGLIIVACVPANYGPRYAYPPMIQPPGWYPDPWQQAPARWWDGYQWGVSSVVAHTESRYQA